MPIDPPPFTLPAIEVFIQGALAAFEVGLFLIFVLYFIFSLIVVRQVNLMTDTLITEVAPVLRFFAVIHAGFALGIVILFFALFFGQL